MPGIFDKAVGKRWPRAQRFGLSPSGEAADASYREMISAARPGAGRESFDAARAAWAGPRQLQPADGLYLGELLRGPRTLTELTEALEPCGSTKAEVKAAIDRLTDLGLVLALHKDPLDR